MRFAPGTDTTPNGVHAREFWEEVYIVEGVVGSGRPPEFGEPVGQGLEAKRNAGSADQPARIQLYRSTPVWWQWPSKLLRDTI
jgi:hypothetical protein